MARCDEWWWQDVSGHARSWFNLSGDERSWHALSDGYYRGWHAVRDDECRISTECDDRWLYTVSGDEQWLQTMSGGDERWLHARGVAMSGGCTL